MLPIGTRYILKANFSVLFIEPVIGGLGFLRGLPSGCILNEAA